MYFNSDCSHCEYGLPVNYLKIATIKFLQTTTHSDVTTYITVEFFTARDVRVINDVVK